MYVFIKLETVVAYLEGVSFYLKEKARS